MRDQDVSSASFSLNLPFEALECPTYELSQEGAGECRLREMAQKGRGTVKVTSDF